MNKYGIAVLLLIIGFLGGYLYGNTTPQEDTHMTNEEMHDDKEDSMSHEMEHSMTVATDREFIEGMIPHHQEAVDTAREVFERGGVIPEIKELAGAIITSQEKEIADMRTWYQNWYDTPFKDTGIYMEMMRDLSTISGKELDVTFITDMIGHHKGAIFMANQALMFSDKKEIRTLSENILKTQQVEIDLMKRVLSEN
ncbi:DUF305 domain-containing protein [Candidatus Kaiserbacteria bacterium]|nr:DUF305 domain-containing protein [Candidatus Kaiserbacteria bacterium]